MSGPYISAGAGVDFLQNEILPADPGVGGAKRALHFVNPGVEGEASFGWGFGNGVRVEIEGNYFNDHDRKISDPYDSPRRVGGFQQLYGGFANVLYDLPLRLPVTPYVGVGVGGQDLSNDDYNQGTPNFVFPGRARSRAQLGAFAYQAIAGFAVPITLVPGLALTTEYRLVGAGRPAPGRAGSGVQHRLAGRATDPGRQPALQQHLPPHDRGRPALRLQRGTSAPTTGSRARHGAGA